MCNLLPSTESLEKGFWSIFDIFNKSSYSIDSDFHFVWFTVLFWISAHIGETAQQKSQKQIQNDQICNQNRCKKVWNTSRTCKYEKIKNNN